jgi:alpha-1,2-glucosyltransferase
MHLPLYSPGVSQDQEIVKSRSLITILLAYDYRVVLETVWFLIINVTTGYIFIHWTFEWPNEPGMAQRFMW